MKVLLQCLLGCFDFLMKFYDGFSSEEARPYHHETQKERVFQKGIIIMGLAVTMMTIISAIQHTT